MSTVNRIILLSLLALGAALPFACTNSAPTGPLATYNLTATPSYTPTYTPTNWAGYTNTYTPTGTPHTSTPTMTVTQTATSTNTSNLTFTATNTPTMTVTSTMTSTMTVTNTFSVPTPAPTSSTWKVQNQLPPNGVAYDGVTVYVAASVESGPGGQIQLFSNSGSYLSEFSSVSFGGTSYTFAQPNGVAYSSFNSTLYMIDQFNNALYPITSPSNSPALASAPLTTWTAVDGGPSTFFGPQGVAADSAGNVYVADANNNAIEIFTSALTASQEVKTGLYNPDAVAVNPTTGSSAATTLIIADAISASSEFNTQIQIYTNPGSGFVPASPASFTIPNADIVGLTMDGSGNIYVADSGNGIVEEYTVSGTLETEGLGITSTDLSPDGLVFLNSGYTQLLVSDFANDALYLVTP